jgi:tetratricopeptide (TPR) repeat protein
MQLEQAKLALYEAGRLWRELDYLPMLTDNMSMACMVHVAAGEYDQAIALSDEAFRISASSNNLWGQSYSRMMICWAYWELGQPERALKMANESVQLGKLAGFVASQVLAGGHQAVIYGNLGAIEQGLDMAQQAVTVAETQFPHFRCHPLGILAQLHLLAGNLAEAETIVDEGRKDPYVEAHPTWNMRIHIAEAELALKLGNYEQAIAVTDHWLPRLRKNDIRAYLPTFLYLRSQAFLATDQTEAARRDLVEAQEIAAAVGLRSALWPVLFALSRLESDATEARYLQRQAREIVETIASHIGAPDLQASFLNQPTVATLIS